MIYIGVMIVIVQQPAQSDTDVVTPEVDRSQPEVSQGSENGHFKAYCRECGWRSEYPTYTRSKQALGGHKRWCKQTPFNQSPFSKPVRF